MKGVGTEPSAVFETKFATNDVNKSTLKSKQLKSGTGRF